MSWMKSFTPRGGSQTRPVFPSRGLYAIADADLIQSQGLSLVECVRAMLDAGAPVIQVRAKSQSSRQIALWLDEIAQNVTRGASLLIQNDRADLADIFAMQGVHLGQEDLPLAEVQNHYPHLLTGISTHNIDELKLVLSEPLPDYVALGPIFSTTTKKDAEAPVGLDILRSAFLCTQEVGIPLVAIGGVTRSLLRRVAEQCDLVAAISLLLPESASSRPYLSLRKNCEEIHKIILESGGERHAE